MTRLLRAGRPVLLTALLAAVLTVPAPLLVAPAVADGEAATAQAYPGDPEAEAALVTAEDSRLVEIRTVDTLAGYSSTPLVDPYRLATGSTYTLVLTARREPYTVKDLLTLAPQTFVQLPDGSYLLSEHLVVNTGATLLLAGNGGLRLRLASDGDGFTSIVNYGGRLDVVGTEAAPVIISSYDRGTHRLDRLTDDGRAYIRSIGGQVHLTYARLSGLGFWSGRTGGLSLTGTDRPNSGQLDDLGNTLQIGKKAERARAAEESADPTPESTPLGGENRPRAGTSQVLPSGPLPVPTVTVDSPQYSFVSASIDHTTVTGNAYGLFVSSAQGLDVRDSAVQDSLVDGIVLHRYVVNAVIASTTSEDNGTDGFLLARATTGIVLSEIASRGNARNGLTMSGLPLADGPSATGISVGSYGNNSVANSDLSGNGRYGVEVVGGVNIGVLSNNVDDNGSVGIVARDSAQKVNIVGNRVNGSVVQGIAVRDGVTSATVTGNIVSGGQTSVYLRDAQAVVRRNTLTDASSHAVSLVGRLGTTELTENTLSGRGPSAIDSQRAQDLQDDSWDNDTGQWEDTTPFLVTLKKFLQPLTLLWILLALLLVFTAVHGARARRVQRHPYHDKLPVSDGRPTPRRDLDRTGV